MNHYPYKSKTFTIELNDDYDVEVTRGEYDYRVIVSAKSAEGRYTLIGPDNDLELANSPEEAIDRACSIILDKIEIAKREDEAILSLRQYYHAQDI